MTEKVKKGNEKSEFPLKRNFSKNTNTARIKKNKQTLPVSSEENLNENTKSKYLPNKKDDINSKNKEEKEVSSSFENLMSFALGLFSQRSLGSAFTIKGICFISNVRFSSCVL